MGDLIRQQRHFLRLFEQTSTAQRRALLETATKYQVKALSQIAHNIINGNVPTSSTEKQLLKKERRLLHLLGDKQLGFAHKKRLIQSKQRILHILVKIAVVYLKAVL